MWRLPEHHVSFTRARVLEYRTRVGDLRPETFRVTLVTSVVLLVVLVGCVLLCKLCWAQPGCVVPRMTQYCPCNYCTGCTAAVPWYVSWDGMSRCTGRAWWFMGK